MPVVAAVEDESRKSIQNFFFQSWLFQFIVTKLLKKKDWLLNTRSITLLITNKQMEGQTNTQSDYTQWANGLSPCYAADNNFSVINIQFNRMIVIIDFK